MTDRRRDECCAEWKKEMLPLSGEHLLVHINIEAKASNATPCCAIRL